MAGTAAAAIAQTADKPVPVFGIAVGAVAAPGAEEVRGGAHFAGSFTPLLAGAMALGFEAHLSFVETQRLWAPLTWGGTAEPRPTDGWYYVLGVGANGSIGKTLGGTRAYVTGGAGAYRITGEMLDGPKDSYGYYPEFSDGYGVFALNGGAGVERRFGGRPPRSLFAETRYHRGVPAGERDGLLLLSGGIRLSRK